jgi:hypothetical protein
MLLPKLLGGAPIAWALLADKFLSGLNVQTGAGTERPGSKGLCKYPPAVGYQAKGLDNQERGNTRAFSFLL